MNNGGRPYYILDDIGVTGEMGIHECKSNVSDAMPLRRSHGSNNS